MSEVCTQEKTSRMRTARMFRRGGDLKKGNMKESNQHLDLPDVTVLHCKFGQLFKDHPKFNFIFMDDWS